MDTLVGRKRGFTLIELLVVVAIIGMLSSIVLANLNEARAKARDAVRASDLGQIRKALQLYADDNQDLYPCVFIASSNAQTGHPFRDNWDTLANLLDPYIPLPSDPLGLEITGAGTELFPTTDGSHTYLYKANDPACDTYDLWAQFELPNQLNCTNRDWKSHTFICPGSSLCDGSCAGGIYNQPDLVSDRP